MRTLALIFAVLAVCAALPAAPPGTLPPPRSDKPDGLVPRPVLVVDDEDSWFPFPFFKNFFAPIFTWFPTFADFGPSVITEDGKYKIVVNVKGYEKKDLKVKLKNGFVITQGTHESTPGDHNLFASQFFHTYSLPANASYDDVRAELSKDGYLTITAPISSSSGDTKRNEGERLVDIVETGANYVPPKPDVEADPAPFGEFEPEGTAAPSRDREEVTEKDNYIPHGKDDGVSI